MASFLTEIKSSLIHIFKATMGYVVTVVIAILCTVSWWLNKLSEVNLQQRDSGEVFAIYKINCGKARRFYHERKIFVIKMQQ